MKFLRGLLVLFLGFFFLSPFVQADSEKEGFLSGLDLRLATIADKSINEATQRMLERYCPNQFRKASAQLQKNTSISWQFVLNNENLSQEFFETCEKFAQVNNLQQELAKEMAERSALITARVRIFIYNQALDDLDFTTIWGKAELIVEALVDANLAWPNILRELQGSDEFYTEQTDASKECLEQKSKAKKSKNSCALCKKRSLILMPCRCGDNFCVTHRYPETHQCTFDYASLGKVEIEMNNPCVETEKIEKI